MDKSIAVTDEFIDGFLESCVDVDDYKELEDEFKNSWWTKSKEIYKKQEYSKNVTLRERLLEVGGDEAATEYNDEDLDKILERGEFLTTDEAYVSDSIAYCDFEENLGIENQCHRNSCALYLSEEVQQDFDYDLKIMTGYALGLDDIWRQHSWCVVEGEEDYIIETTQERYIYYGFRMNEEEAKEFCSWY